MLTRSLVSVAALLLISTAARAAEIPADLKQAVHAYDEAQIKGNRAELERLVADDYTLLNSSGKIQNKAQLIADYTAPGFHIEPFVVMEPVEKVWTDGAVMGGIATLRGTDGGKAFSVTLRFSDIWAKRNGKWQVIYTTCPAPRTSVGSDCGAVRSSQAAVVGHNKADPQGLRRMGKVSSARRHYKFLRPRPLKWKPSHRFASLPDSIGRPPCARGSPHLRRCA